MNLFPIQTSACMHISVIVQAQILDAIDATVRPHADVAAAVVDGAVFNRFHVPTV